MLFQRLLALDGGDGGIINVLAWHCSVCHGCVARACSQKLCKLWFRSVYRHKVWSVEKGKLGNGRGGGGATPACSWQARQGLLGRCMPGLNRGSARGEAGRRSSGSRSVSVTHYTSTINWSKKHRECGYENLKKIQHSRVRRCPSQGRDKLPMRLPLDSRFIE